MNKRSGFFLPFIKELDKDMPKGRAVLLLWVDDQGNVRNLRLLESSGHRNLDEGAIRGGWRVRFEPWVVEEKAIPVSVVLPVQIR